MPHRIAPVLVLRLVFMCLAALSFSGCKSEDMKPKHEPIDWKTLGASRIFFGHQSVGENILEGIQDILKDTQGVSLRLLKTRDPESLPERAFAHADVGRNGDPKSKCDDFEGLMDKGFGDKTDIAFFKFCFVDIMADAQVEDIFSYYRSTIERLKERYPRTIFVHITVPLVKAPTGPKAWIKRALGTLGGWDADNAARNRYNELLLEHYKGKEPVFDLAGIESTFPDGRRCSFRYKGRRCYSLVPAYTDDGGHLNPVGRRIAAERLLGFLSGVARKQEPAHGNSP